MAVLRLLYTVTIVMLSFPGVLYAQPRPSTVKARYRSELLPPLPPVPIVVDVGPNTIECSNVEAGGKLVLFGVIRQALDTSPKVPTTVIRAEMFTDDDEDGVVTIDFPGGVPLQAMWVAVDYQRGERAEFATPGFEPTIITLSSNVVPPGAPGERRRIEWPFGEINTLSSVPMSERGTRMSRKEACATKIRTTAWLRSGMTHRR